MPQPIDDDSTIKLTRPASKLTKPASSVRKFRVPAWAIAAPIALVVLAVAGGWLLWPSAPPGIAMPPVNTLPLAARPDTPLIPPGPVAAVPQGAAVPPVADVPSAAVAEPNTASAATRSMREPSPTSPDQRDFSIEVATERQILDHVPAEGAPDPAVFRFKANPRILVLDFASLLDQGRTLNRVAALVEKTGLPHDRLLSDTELDTAVRAGGDTVETYYYGHDYGAPSLIRFFALADRDNVRLAGEEDGLRRLIRQEGWFEPTVRAALISIPQIGANARVTRSARATILHHELSHGEYFTDPDFVAFVHRFWTQTLAAAERDRIRRYLHSLGYDSTLPQVMENEAQAYLMFTDSAEFFTPDMIGMSRARLTDLRNGFFRAMPAGWLRDSLGQFLMVNNTAAAAPP